MSKYNFKVDVALHLVVEADTAEEAQKLLGEKFNIEEMPEEMDETVSVIKKESSVRIKPIGIAP